MKTDDKILRIREMMFMFNLNQSEFADKIGINQSNFSAILKGKRPCGNGVTDKIKLSFPEINDKWLDRGEGNMLSSSPAIHQVNNGTNNGSMMCANNIFGNNIQGCPTHTETEEVEAIPYVDTALVSKRNYDIRKAINNDDELLKQKTINELFSPISYMQKMVDDSMQNEIRQGDIIFVKFLPIDANIVSGKIYLINTNSYGTLVRQVYVNEESFTLHAFNPAYEDIEVKRDDIFNSGRVVHSLRSSFLVPDETISILARESAKQVSQLMDIIQKQNAQQEKLMDIILKNK